jgi:hypothetical protein
VSNKDLTQAVNDTACATRQSQKLRAKGQGLILWQRLT